MTVRVTAPAKNVREELSKLNKPSGVAGEAMLRAETPQEQFNLIGAGRKNLIINGGFLISQRGSFTTASSATDTAYSVDRFKNFVKVVTADVQHTKATTVDGVLKSTLKMTATSTASGRLGIRQYIEADSTKVPYAGQIVTLSVWMKSNNTDAGLYIYDYGNTGYYYRTKHSGSGEWEKLTLTFPMSTGNVTQNGYGVELNFAMQSDVNGSVNIATGDYVEIAEPQLELGSVATPFEHRSYGEELALCQRYYESGSIYAFGARISPYHENRRFAAIYFRVSKRTTPTVTATVGFDAAGTVNSVIGHIDMMRVYSLDTSSYMTVSGFTADAEL